ncbi:sigma-70 family RNA polymerase sigma factor [Oscillatoria sp. CS-180]|uniref:RNA polymerase sigma factor n=1 Tax=Oscillatoria sp. CS-180 TaxID=3021720 RepID=UPI00232F4EDB|nr:sigma-70 family RNA polymerase sigma factor [Oscillatoria sp. CS-180]MDB9526664.1 sigma-70 family RNA polymerase sigma factor [Oscillatoria sp. CS-180]
MSQSREEYDHGLQELNDYLSRVLAVDAAHSDRSLLFFIQRRLSQYHLDDHLAIDDILHEAVLRTQKAIQDGEVIRCLPAWMNRVCFNIIRERSREYKSRKKLNYQLVQELDVNTDDIEPVFEIGIKKIDSLLSSWRSLKEADRNILILRHVDKYSWREIAARFSEIEGKEISEQTIRKRGERALSKLRESFRKAISCVDLGLQE